MSLQPYYNGGGGNGGTSSSLSRTGTAPFMSSLMSSPIEEFMQDMMMGPFGGLDGGGSTALMMGGSPLMAMHHRMMRDVQNIMSNALRDDSGTLSDAAFSMSGPTGVSFSSTSVQVMGANGRPVYVASSSSRSAPGGVYEAQRSVVDSRYGARTGHTRGLGERSHTRVRESTLDGETHTFEDIRGLEGDEEVRTFHKEWNQAADTAFRSGLSLEYARGGGRGGGGVGGGGGGVRGRGGSGEGGGSAPLALEGGRFPSPAMRVEAQPSHVPPLQSLRENGTHSNISSFTHPLSSTVTATPTTVPSATHSSYPGVQRTAPEYTTTSYSTGRTAPEYTTTSYSAGRSTPEYTTSYSAGRSAPADYTSYSVERAAPEYTTSYSVESTAPQYYYTTSGAPYYGESHVTYSGYAPVQPSPSPVSLPSHSYSSSLYHGAGQVPYHGESGATSYGPPTHMYYGGGPYTHYG